MGLRISPKLKLRLRLNDRVYLCLNFDQIFDNHLAGHFAAPEVYAGRFNLRINFFYFFDGGRGCFAEV